MERTARSHSGKGTGGTKGRKEKKCCPRLTPLRATSAGRDDDESQLATTASEPVFRGGEEPSDRPHWRVGSHRPHGRVGSHRALGVTTAA